MNLRLRPKLSYAFVVMAIAWMAVIFLMSAFPAEDSGRMSGGIAERLLRIFVRDYDSLSPERQQTLYKACDHIIRKVCHGCEYALLAFLLYFSYKLSGRNWIVRCLPALFLTILYAIGDEIHQYFVPGRACRVSDMLIDAGGATFGVIFSSFVAFIFHKRTK